MSEKAMCRCGHEFNYHAPMDDEGQLTKHQPCHGYGCECGKFEVIDWDEVDANREASMAYQRNIRQ